MKFFKKDSAVCLAFIFLSLLVFSQGLALHGVEFRDDEIFYFRSTQEMIQQKDFLVPTYFGEYRFQKPILYYWLILGSCKIFGVNWFGARFVAVLFAALTVGLTWILARDLFDRKTAHLSALVLMTTPLFFRHAKNAVPDMPLNFFIVLAVYAGWKFLQDPSRKKFSMLFFVSGALGFMVKGFAALILPALIVGCLALVFKKTESLRRMNIFQGLGIYFAIIAPWFLYMFQRFGGEYFRYMLVDETKNRIAAPVSGPFFLHKLTEFVQHSLFYLQTIFSYFAPWSLFLFLFLIWSVLKRGELRLRGDVQHAGPAAFLWIWMACGFFLFAPMYFVINHYMLVLSTPAAIGTAYFLARREAAPSWFENIFSWIKIHVTFGIFTLGYAVFGFVVVFLGGAGRAWLPVFLGLYVLSAVIFAKRRQPLTAVGLLAGLLLFVQFQSAVLVKAGLSTHAVFQEFAQLIHRQMPRNPERFAIGVGSHDIHEKEVQVYFDRRVEKAATVIKEETPVKLHNFLQNNRGAYCLVTEEDYDKYTKYYPQNLVKIVAQDYVLRKRFHIDRNFFAALLRLDQEKIHDYLMERLLLIREGEDA